MKKKFLNINEIKHPKITYGFFTRLGGCSNNIYESFKSKKEIISEENKTRKFAFHSVVSKKNIQKNEIFSWKNLTTKRPGTGDFPSHKIYSLFGKKSKKYIQNNRLIKKSFIK